MFRPFWVGFPYNQQPFGVTSDQTAGKGRYKLPKDIGFLLHLKKLHNFLFPFLEKGVISSVGE